jgi:4'-phosphopantetheinyl transferase
MPMGTKDTILAPIILAVPPEDQRLKGREQVRNLSEHARRAASVSATDSGTRLNRFPKTDHGAPMPVNGWYWSISHKRQYVAGVVARQPVGIDIELIKPISAGLHRKVATDAEWRLGSESRTHLFFRFWTAKESLTKATGVGYADFSECRILEIPDATTLVVAYRDRRHIIRHFLFDGHIASVPANGHRVFWRIVDSSAMAP